SGLMITQTDAPSKAEITSPSRIGFCYVWNTKISMRAVSDDDAVILIVSPKFATVHDHVSFQWSLKIHGTTGRFNGSDDDLVEEDDPPSDYVAVELYFVDGPVSQVDVRAVVRVMQKDAKNDDKPEIVEERKTISMQRGRGMEVTGKDRTPISQFLQDNVDNVVKVSVLIKMDAKLFDPYTYLDKVSPTPHKSFLTTNYNARVNSKVWRRRSRKLSTRKMAKDENGKVSRKEKVDFEKKFAEVMEQEREKLSVDVNRLRVGEPSSRRGSTQTLLSHHHSPDHEHLFKKLLISCCESCERRRASFAYSKTEDEAEDGEETETSEEEEEKCFECRDSDKEHVHDLLANMYFNKIVLPGMEYVEDFVDFLIDAELNDLPVLKRACERYLCGELNTKKDLLTSLLLDLLFISIVFQLPVMKSMTLSELSNRTEELSQPDKLMEDDEYKVLDKRVRSLSDRNLVELIEQCIAFAEQRNRVQVITLSA
uniref:BTB domain-containing protein n=1 Tax=Haemonchus contortus TaxID=6289 RepID=A0A7I4XY26_HAECO